MGAGMKNEKQLDQGPGTIAAWLDECPFLYSVQSVAHDADGETVALIINRPDDCPGKSPPASYEFAPEWVARVLNIPQADAGRVISGAYESEYFYARLVDLLDEIERGPE